MGSYSLTQVKADEMSQILLQTTELNLSFELLDPGNDVLVQNAAACLTESFMGIEIKGEMITEPMLSVSKLSRDDFYEFVLGYLRQVVGQELCFIARDKKNGRVVGVAACEDLDPNEELPIYSGNLEPMNKIIEFLSELDQRLFSVIEQKRGEKIKKHEYVHAFMGGVITKKSKRYVLIKLLEMLINHAAKKGYKGIYVEATNPRSANMSIEYCGFHLVYDASNHPVLSKYCDNETFKTVPESNSPDCRILYRPLQPGFDI